MAADIFTAYEALSPRHQWASRLWVRCGLPNIPAEHRSGWWKASQEFRGASKAMSADDISAFLQLVTPLIDNPPIPRQQPGCKGIQFLSGKEMNAHRKAKRQTPLRETASP
jgi:hypothetical protein